MPATRINSRKINLMLVGVGCFSSKTILKAQIREKVGVLDSFAYTRVLVEDITGGPINYELQIPN